ncbi:unnamed protein product [Caenorhabditis brenneri]
MPPNFGMKHSDDEEKSKSSAGEPQRKKRKIAKAEKQKDDQDDECDTREKKVKISSYWQCKHVEAIRPFDPERMNGHMPTQKEISQAIRIARQYVTEVLAYTKSLAENELAEFHKFNTERNRQIAQFNSDSQSRDDEQENGESGTRTSGEAVNEPVENEDNPETSEDLRGSKTIRLKVPNELQSKEMAYFAPIGENMKGNDEMQCRYFPLLGADTDDMAIGRGLYDKYPNGIHGYEPDKYEFSYQMLFDVMLKMLPSTSKETSELMYYALYYLFPNFGSQQGMSEIFPKLARAFASSEAQLEEYLALEPWTDALPNEETNKKPFDYKHPCSEKHHFVKTIKSSSQNPCSESCFKNTLEQDILLELRIEKSTKENCNFLNELVLNDDKILIENFCKVARKFDDKNCSEWFKFSSKFSSEYDKRRTNFLPHQKRCHELLKTIKNLEDHKLQSPESPESHNSKSLESHKPKKIIVSLSPCCHFGPCGPNNTGCSCEGLCSIYCQCDYNCCRKFLGCRCTSNGNDCSLTDCICVRVGWECIESTCKQCYCDSSQKSCRNNSITKMEDKSISVRKSNVAGNGAFTDVDLEVDDFIGLYTGEVLSEDESERRGRLYELGSSYLFELNDTGISVDAGRAGNALRFVNHGGEKLLPYSNSRSWKRGHWIFRCQEN